MMNISIHCDALGNPVELGNKYGWSTSKNGFAQVVIGIAEKLTNNGVTLKVESGKKCLYTDDPKPLIVGSDGWEGIKAKINIKGIHLFPVQ